LEGKPGLDSNVEQWREKIRENTTDKTNEALELQEDFSLNKKAESDHRSFAL
jgi:hypothetical protein